MKINAALTDLIAAQAEAKEKQYKMGDGGGMFLLVMPDGAKYWRVTGDSSYTINVVSVIINLPAVSECQRLQ